MHPIAGKLYRITDEKEGVFIGRVMGDPDGRHIEIEMVDPLKSTTQLDKGHSTQMIEKRLKFETYTAGESNG